MKIITGDWFCSYTGKYYFTAMDIDIDYIVVLRHAYEVIENNISYD